MNKLGLDIDTRVKKEIIGRLKKLKTTVAVSDRGEYHQEMSTSMLWIDTELTEDQLDMWLYDTKFKNNDFMYGLFVRKEDQLIE